LREVVAVVADQRPGQAAHEIGVQQQLRSDGARIGHGSGRQDTAGRRIVPILPAGFPFLRRTPG
jgi:hypothetical protein